ncbi:MAG TPA: hypothetical protein VI756_15365, partial [Blastocatellia bacterium]
HQVKVKVEYAPVLLDEAGYHVEAPIEEWDDDPRWPTVYPCGRLVTSNDVRQLFSERLYRRSDTGDLIEGLNNAPPGAMWDAWWHRREDLPGALVGADGISLTVMCPDGHEWFVDAQCSNCTMPDDFYQLHHHCWVRHGTVPNITVDKAGATCRAGAGSIATGHWHGFLRNGELVDR